MPLTLNKIGPRKICGAFAVLGIPGICGIAEAQQPDWGVFVDYDIIAYSESFSTSDIVDFVDGEDIEGRGFSDGGDTFSHTQWSAGVRRGAWELAFLKREDTYGTYTPETALLIFANETDTEVSSDDLDIDLRVNHSESLGLRLAYQYDINPSLSLTGRISGLLASEIFDGRVNGTLSVSDTDVEGNLIFDYAFTDDIVFEREFESSDGYGVSLDAIINWQASENLSVEIGAYDVANRIWWDGITRTQGDASTAVTRTTDNGVLLVRPVLSGTNSFDLFTQKLRTRIKADINYNISDRWGLSQDIYKTGNNYLTQSEAKFKLNSDFEVGLNYEWVTSAPGVTLKWKAFKIEIATDNLKTSAARFSRLNLGLSFDFP